MFNILRTHEAEDGSGLRPFYTDFGSVKHTPSNINNNSVIITKWMNIDVFNKIKYRSGHIYETHLVSGVGVLSFNTTKN